MEQRRKIALHPLALLLTAVLLNACGDEGDKDSSSDEAHGDHEHDAGEPPEEEDAGPPPARYVFATQVFTGDTAVTQVVASDSATPGKLSLSGSVAVPGRAIVAASGDDSYVFVGSGDSPVLKRYALSEDGELEEGPSVSFQGKGVAGIGEYQTQFQFISKTKAYYFDAKSAQAVVWNPETMRVTSSIDLSALASANHIIAFASTPARRGSEVVMPVGFRSLNNTQIIKEAAIVLIDSDDDSVTIARDDRCGYVRDAVTLADGTIYAATEAYGSAVHRLNNANAESPCLLRIPAGKKSFDTSFHFSLNELADGKTVGSLAVLPSGETYVKVLDEKLTNIMPMTSPRALASAPAWGWSQITLGDAPKLKAVTALPPTAGSIIWFKAEDTLLVAEFVNMSESTKLRNLSDGSGDVVVESQGLLFSLAQVR